MTAVLLLLVRIFRDSLRSQATLHIELLALRHQLHVLERSRRPRVRLTRLDRLLWVWLSRSWTDWRTALVIVKPETVIAWHRQGFRLFWTWKSRHRTGRPGVPADVRALIRTMSAANPLRGAPRIHGELLKLGIDVGQTSCQPPSSRSTWSVRRNPRRGSARCDSPGTSSRSAQRMGPPTIPVRFSQKNDAFNKLEESLRIEPKLAQDQDSR